MSAVATATVAETVTPEVVAAMAAAARHAAIPVPSPHGAAVAAPVTVESLTADGRALVARIGTPEDASKMLDRKHAALVKATEEHAAAEVSMTEWLGFARQAYGVMSVKAFAEVTGKSGQTLGRLYGAAVVFDAYARRGNAFRLTVAEAVAVGNSSRGVKGCLTLVESIRKRVDLLDVKAHREAGKPVPGNYKPTAPKVDASTLPEVAEVATVAEVAEVAETSHEVSHDETPDLGATVAPAGSTDTRTVETSTLPVLPVSSADWVILVGNMGASAHLVAASKRDDLRQAALALVAALDALDGMPVE